MQKEMRRILLLFSICFDCFLWFVIIGVLHEILSMSMFGIEGFIREQYIVDLLFPLGFSLFLTVFIVYFIIREKNKEEGED